MMRAALLLVCLVGAASGLQVGSQFTGQYNDPETSAEHPLFRIHANGTLINLPSYEPAGIEPNLDTTGPVSGMLVHHIDAAGRPDLACDSAAGKNYSGKIVLVKRGVCHFVLKIRNIQAAHATAVVVYDNKREGWIRMAWDRTVQPEIPAIFIQKNEADHLLYYMDSAAGTTGLEATLLPDNENSLRLTIDSLTEQLPGLMNVEGTVESRRTVEGHMGTDYMKYKVSGSINTDTGVVSLSPKEWITTAKDDEQGWFGLEGNLLTPAKTMSGKTTPFKSHFHMREIEPNDCPARVAFVEKCQATGENQYCGQGCLEVTDENGYRVFNDGNCAFTEPLMWYCKVNTNADQIDGDAKYACEGERLILKPPIVKQPNTCPAGQKQMYPYFTEWPTSVVGSQPNPTDWSLMTNIPGETQAHGYFTTHLCKDLDCNSTDSSKGWRLRGGYAESGPDKLPNSKSVLVYHLNNVKVGAEVLFTYASDGEPKYDYLEFEVCLRDGLCQSVSQYKYDSGTNWKRAKVILKRGGNLLLKWSYVKDRSLDRGSDEARLLELAVVGYADDAQCRDCPADHCSTGRIDGCQACPTKTFSAPGSSTCKPCAGPKPLNAHYKMSNEFRSTDCQLTCDPGYVQSGAGASFTCLPRPDVCLLPKDNKYNGKFDPPSFAMLQQCLSLRHSLTFFCDDAKKTLTNIKKAQGLDADSTRRANFYAGVDKMLANLNNAVDCSTVFDSDFKFHQKILELLREVDGANSLPDASYIYTPPLFYQQLFVYLPIRFNYTSDGGQNRMFVDSISEMARMVGYRSNHEEVNSVLGWEVTEVDGTPAESAFKSFAESQVGFSPDPTTRFDLGVRGDYPTLWACSFAVRDLSKCGLPPAERMSLKLTNPQSKQTKTVSLMWTVMYLGDDCGSATDAMETMQCNEHPAKDWLDCERYSEAKGAEQGHTRLALDDMGDEDLAVELHHKVFDHKDLMATGQLSKTSHMTHYYNDMTLSVMDSYEHIAAYSHVDQTGTATGIIRVASFHGEAEEVHAVLMEISALNPNRLVIDLRTNGGGHVCHAMQLLYLVSSQSSNPPTAWFDFAKSDIMDMYASNQSFYGSAHPEFALNPENFLSKTTGDPYQDISWYESNSAGSHSQVVGMNCERYSSLLEYYRNDEKKVTRKLNSFEPSRLQVLVDSQCIGACALFARTVALKGLGSVVGVGVSTAGTAPSGISADLDGLECQRRAMKIEDSVPAGMLIDHMPYRGQNLVIPLTRLYTPSLGARRAQSPMPLSVAPSVSIPSGTYRPDFKEGTWYSGMQLYCAAIKLFDPSTTKYKPGCPHCTEEDCPEGGAGGMSVGWAFFFIFVGIFIVPCGGAVAYYIMQHGCSKDCLSNGLQETSYLCYRCFSKCREFGMKCCGSRWERSYGSLSGDPSDGMPAQGCCQGFDWRSYIPGMKGSALQDQYSDLQTGGELNTMSTSDPSSSINDYAPAGDYAPAMTRDSRVEVTPLSPRAVEVTEVKEDSSL